MERDMNDAMDIYADLCKQPIGIAYALWFKEKTGHLPAWTPTQIDWNNGQPRKKWAHFYKSSLEE